MGKSGPTPPILKSLTIHGYRSIRHATITFDNPTFVVGKNGAGKSNLVDALAFLGEIPRRPLSDIFHAHGGFRSVLHRGGGDQRLGMSVELSPSSGFPHATYAFEIESVGEFGYRVTHERLVVARPDQTVDRLERKDQSVTDTTNFFASTAPSGDLLLPFARNVYPYAAVADALRGVRVFQFDPFHLRRAQRADEGLELRSDAENVFSVLHLIQDQEEHKQRVDEWLSVLLGCDVNYATTKAGEQLLLSLTLQWAPDKSVIIDASEASDGTLCVLGMLAAIYQSRPPSVMAIEEPEANVHPGALGVWVDLMSEATDRWQLVVTTHSPELLESKWIRGKHLRYAVWKDGETRLGGVAPRVAQCLEDRVTNVGALLRSNALAPEERLLNGAGPDAPLFAESPK